MAEPKVTVTFKRQELADDSPDLSYLEQDCFAGSGENDGPARLAAYERGDWHMFGIRAVATICIQRGNCRTNYEISSPGLWGIESDSEPSYLDPVFKEECSQLQADIELMAKAEFKL